MGAYRDAKLVLGEFLPLCKGVTYTRSLTRKNVLAYHTVLRAKGNSLRTVWNKHNRLLWFLRHVKGDVSIMPSLHKVKAKTVTVYESKEIEAILEAAKPY